MKFSLKLLSLMMALLMLVSTVMLTSCDNDDTRDDPTVDTTTEPAQTGGEDDSLTASSDIELIVNGKTQFKVIRDDDLDSGAGMVTSASSLYNYIIQLADLKSGNLPEIITDWKKPTEEYDHDSFEILVGYTDYEETQSALAEIPYGDYIVKVIGKKLVVAGYTDEAVARACLKVKTLLSDNYVDGNLIIPADTLITDTYDKMLGALPAYENGTFSAALNSGNDGAQVIIAETTQEGYAAYVKKLESIGYTTYTTNTITENSFTTLTNADYTINVGYYDYEKSTRIIIEPLVDPIGLKEDNVYTAVTTSQITMLGLEYNDDSNIGLSMLIRLTDGRFIVIDGGYTGRASVEGPIMAKTIKEQAAGYIKDGEKITIAAWIITHPHGDHSGMIEKAYGSFKGMKVEQFIVNFLAQTELDKTMASSSYGANYGSSDASKYKGVLTAAKALGADVRYVRVGQVLYLADATLEVLYTIDSYAPKLCNALNTTSLIIKFTFDDGTTFMMTGDATGGAFQIANKMYGSYLKSDILQVSHHGCSTWNNDAGTIAAYKKISPATLLWPSSQYAYSYRKAYNWNIVLFATKDGGSNSSFQECYVAGKEGETVTIPIPYQVGNAIEVRK